MKKQLLSLAVLCAVTLSVNAQTEKGTSAVSFGVNVTSVKTSGNNFQSESKNNTFTLGYGYFIKNNSKIGLDLTYGLTKNGSNETYNQEIKSYGGNLTYQRYFPIVKTLFAYAGGKGSYEHAKNKNLYTDVYGQSSTFAANQYSVGAYGGITWFVSKRFALETSLLSADVIYSKTDRTETFNYGNTYTKSEYTSFNFSSQGFINNLGFKIYILF